MWTFKHAVMEIFFLLFIYISIYNLNIIKSNLTDIEFLFALIFNEFNLLTPRIFIILYKYRNRKLLAMHLSMYMKSLNSVNSLVSCSAGYFE